MEINYLRRSKVSELKLNNYKIIGFGAGVLGLKTINYLDNPFDYFIDNSIEKVANGWKEYTTITVDVPIKHFSELEADSSDKLAVIICSEHYTAMGEQLIRAYPDVNVFYSPLLKDYEVFSGLLKCSENILVSAYGGAGGIYLVNGQTGKYRLIKQGSFRGTTIYKGEVYIASEQGDVFQINSLEKNELELKFKQDNRANTHGILYWEEHNLMFVTETLNDCISVYEMPSFEKIKEIPLSYKSQYKGGNYHHINDLCLFKDKLYLSVISKSGNFYNEFLDGVILELDYINGKKPIPILEKLLFPHAINEVDGKLMLLNSFNGDILTIANEVIINLPGFIRGMDSNNGLLYVGQSRHRQIERAKLHYNGISMESGIYIVDPVSKMYRFVHLPEMCDIFNVRVLN